MNVKYDLTKGNITKALLVVAIPTLFGSLIQMSYNLIDMFWVARVDQLGYVPEQAVSAVGTVGFYPWFGFGLIFLAKIGTSVLISQAAGENDMNRVRKTGNNGLILMAFFGVLYTLFGRFGASMFVGWFDTGSANVDQFAIIYMQIVTLAGMSYFIVNLFNGVYDGLGKTVNTLLVTSSGIVLNIILDPIFILKDINIFGIHINGLGLGVPGAAYATAIGQTSILVIYLIIYLSKHRPFKIQPFKDFDFEYIKRISRIGVFVGLQSILFTFISMMIARMVVSYGRAPMAIQRVGSQIESVAWMIASGFQVALASFVGQNFGARQYDRIRDGYKRSMRILVPYGIAVNVLLFVFAEELFGIFFTNPDTLLIGKTYLEILSVSQLFMIVELATAGVFNGLGKTFYPSTVSIVGNILRIPGAIVLGAGLGYAGIWMAVSGSSVIKGTVLVIWLIYFLRKLGKPGGLVFEN
jgi:putative MATE family efflux protein